LIGNANSSMSSDLYGQVLHPEDIQNLTREGTVIAGDRPSIHRIHKRRLNRSSDEEYKDLTLPSPPSTISSRASSVSVNDFETVPDYLVSRESLVYLGFTDAAANAIWDRWIDFGNDQGREIDGGPVTFESMFRSHIYGNGTDTYLDDDNVWREIMNSTGINQSLQDAIMTPSCKDMRLMESCKYWLLDTVSAKYASLKEIQAASRERAMAARRAATRSSGSGSGNGSQYALPPSQIPSSSGSRSTSEVFNGTPGMSAITTSSPAARENAPGHTVLYRGGYSTTILKIFDEQDNAIGDKLSELQTTRPGDFNSTKNAVYMAIDFEVAQKYAFWCKRRDPSSAVSVLRMEIPNAAIEGLSDEERLRIYWPSQEWKQLVWKCRRRQPLKNHIAKYARATLVIGTICAKPNDLIANLDASNNITQSMTFIKKDGGDAFQFAFIDDQGLEFLAVHGIKCVAHRMNRRNMQELEATIGGM
jgi:hypothetical protein